MVKYISLQDDVYKELSKVKKGSYSDTMRDLLKLNKKVSDMLENHDKRIKKLEEIST